MDAMLDHVELTCEVSFCLDGIIDRVEGMRTSAFMKTICFLRVLKDSLLKDSQLLPLDEYYLAQSNLHLCHPGEAQSWLCC